MGFCQDLVLTFFFLNFSHSCMCHDISLFFKSNFIYLFILVVLGLHCCARFSLVTANEGYSLDVV